ncbi:MAG: twin-arginine translocase TatA/TatE family subunit [Rikenellaceae bacterium]
MNLLFIGGLGTGELVVIAVVLLVFFGGAKLPALMRGAGRGIREFKDAINEPAESIKQREADEKAAEESKAKEESEA